MNETISPPPPSQQQNASDIKRTQKKNFALIAAGLIGLLFLSAWLGSSDDKKSVPTPEKPALQTIALGSDAVDEQGLWLHHAENLIHQQQKEMEEIKENLDKFSQEKIESIKMNQSTQEKIEQLTQKIESLEKTFAEQKSTPPAIATDTKGNALTPLPHNENPVGAYPTLTQGIKNDSLALSSSNTPSSPNTKTPDTYVPAGTFAKAVLLSGLDASAGVTSQTEPRPVILRIVDSGTLPNNVHSHLKDCMVTGAGFGDISSERVYIRLERISCVRGKNQVIDLAVFGYVSGPDGKAGVRGVAVWRENALLERSFISGLFSGIGQGIANTYNHPAFSPLTAPQSISGSDLLKSSLTTGTSTALGKLADYNIKRAEQYQPVIQVSATIVNIVFHTGFFLEEKPSTDVPEFNNPSSFPALPTLSSKGKTHENL